jgi:hypothetical protein
LCFVFCVSFIYFRDQLQLSRKATTVNKTALVETEFRLMKSRCATVVRDPIVCVSVCVCVCLLLYIMHCSFFDNVHVLIFYCLLLMITECISCNWTTGSSFIRLSGNYCCMLLCLMSNYHTYAAALASPLSYVLIEIMFLGAFTKLRKATISFVMSVRLSVRPSTWYNSAPTRRILWNLICEYFWKNCRENSCLISVWREKRVLYTETARLFFIISRSFLLRMRNVYHRTGQATGENMVHALCVLDN